MVETAKQITKLGEIADQAWRSYVPQTAKSLILKTGGKFAQPYRRTSRIDPQTVAIRSFKQRGGIDRPMMEQPMIEPRPAMSMKPKCEFQKPAIFLGREEDDAYEWLAAYEAAAKCNYWGPRELITNFPMYLGGTAEKWWWCLSNKPTTWEDEDRYNGEIIHGLRNRFLADFLPCQFSLVTKLRNRVQGATEGVVSYYYDVLYWCNRVDPSMTEDAKLRYFFHGLIPSLFNQVYPLNPKTSDEFLRLAKAAQSAQRHDANYAD